MMEKGMARLEGIMERINRRLNHVEVEIDDLRNAVRSETDMLGKEIDDLRSEMQGNFRWLVAMIIGVLLASMWVTIILAAFLKK